MAGSQYAYVRNFELPDPVLPNVYMVVRIDGKGFHRFSEQHAFAKPNDARALELMNAAAHYVVESLRPDVTLAFGESDEYSFLLRRDCTLYKRRQSKLVTHIVSLFSSAYVYNWSRYLPDTPLQYPPSFDGRLVPYPGDKEVRDYFAWRQADTHINNLYNTTFWALVLQGKLSEHDAHKTLEGTVSSQKNSILFERFGINYNKLPALFRKGTTLAWDTSIDQSQLKEDSISSRTGAPPYDEPGVHMSPESGTAQTGASEPAKRQINKTRLRVRTLHVDIIGSAFWKAEELAKQRTHSTAASVGGHRMADAAASKFAAWEDPDRLQRAAGLGHQALALR